MDALSTDAPVLVRRAAERLHRFDIGAAADRLHFDPASGACRYHDLVCAITRRRLLHALEVARAEAE